MVKLEADTQSVATISPPRGITSSGRSVSVFNTPRKRKLFSQVQTARKKIEVSVAKECFKKPLSERNESTVRQFRSAYTKILVHTELKESSRRNCVPLEHINILQGSKPVDNLQQINATPEKNRIAAAVDEIKLFPSDIEYLEDHRYALEVSEHVSELAHQVVLDLMSQMNLTAFGSTYFNPYKSIF
ncbi:hypothetical protein ILUMI_01595 [Ignelater luminosus]|uniref:Uncharacterized protein n=1 Tax=Ignelater luminosus TaxID=2038154 RepID=A0A8K0GH99_IGNLU|nr:hypothetical protein ILUMI_01595 [Ignelater luminosus]